MMAAPLMAGNDISNMDDSTRSILTNKDVIAVDHTDSPAEMARRGRDIERSVLARGLMAHLQDRVLRDGLRTVVFG